MCFRASLHSSHPGFIIPASHACVQPVFEHCLFCRVQGQHLDKRLLVRHKSLVATHCQDGDGSGHTNTHWHTKQPQAYLTTESVRGSIPLRIKQTPQPLGAEPMASSHYLTVFICSIILEGLLCFYRPVCLPTHPPTYPPIPEARSSWGGEGLICQILLNKNQVSFHFKNLRSIYFSKWCMFYLVLY